jgi:molybdopterin-guanine dinucleotide biosynthesis protein A
MAAGFILAGGFSGRMGRDKALLPFRDRTLLEFLLESVSAVASPVAISGAPAKYGQFGYPVVADLRAGQGPLAGIEACLTATREPRNLFVACDMPGFPDGLLARLIEGTAACVLPITPDGRLHPLCAVWDRSLLPLVTAALDRGARKVLDVLAGATLETVPVPWLSNANTAEEWERLAAQ